MTSFRDVAYSAAWYLPRSVFKGIKERKRYSDYFAAMRGRVASTDSLLQRLKASYQPVNLPLVMVSQAERSGGSLMAQLFDGHPQLLAHPHELKIGYPNKRIWPPLDVANVDEQFRLLFELNNIDFFQNGYSKGKHNPERMNFFLAPQIQRELFRDVLGKSSGRAPRDVLNAYFTSYFNAWLNMRTRIEQTSFITGFVPMMAAQPENMDQFWAAYPDGYLISIIRSPLSWHPSFVKLKGGTVEETAARWNSSTEAMFRERERNKNRVIVVKFDDVVKQTEATMRLICNRIGIDFDPILISPTFNLEPIRSNSVFATTTPGVVNSAPAQRESLLSDTERNYLAAHCMPLYERALSEIVETV
jgi:hypothetical protein